jgi:Outer membrane protein beta-barrel domain
MMKKIIYALLFLFVLLNSSLSAQTGVRFGLKGGYSMSTQYGITDPGIPYTVDTLYKHGGVGGIFVYFPITESFGVQQEILCVMKGSSQDISMDVPPLSSHTEYNLNYLELPFVIRYTFVKMGNFKIYGSSGFALSILLNGKSRIEGVVDMGSVQIPFTESTKLEGVDIFDYGFLYGAGLEFKFFGKECFFEYRFNIGWNTLMMPTSAGQAPAPLRNQDYIFTLGIYL